MTHYDSIIIGAGAAGLFCAIEAGKRGRKTLLIEKSKTIGDKIRISGGGRCNFTNINTHPRNYLSQNPHFCKSALSRYTADDFIKLIERYNIAYHEKTLGQLFCDGSAKQIIAMLQAECEAAKVETLLQVTVDKLSKSADSNRFQLALSNGKHLTSEAVIIATGGPSIPKMGASDWGYHIAKQFGLKVIKPEAALVPFTLDADYLQHLKPLAGVSQTVTVEANGTKFNEAMLFTHRGLSGPSMLQISSYWKQGDNIVINLLPERDVLAELKERRNLKPKQEIQTILSEWLPRKLAAYLCETYQLGGKLAEQSNAHLERIAQQLTAWKLKPNGTEGFRTAEVTRGGVDTNELSSKTMEAKKIKSLYFIGEVVDVTGHLGGYNFQWAWASGWACGQVC